MISKRTERWLANKQTFLDKCIEILINIGWFIFIITLEAVRIVAIVGGIIGFWYGMYYIIKSLLL